VEQLIQTPVAATPPAQGPPSAQASTVQVAFAHSAQFAHPAAATLPICDSGASHTLVRQSDAELYLTDVHPGGHLNVLLPNGSAIQSIATGRMRMADGVPPITAHVCPDYALQRTLVSVADLANAGCSVIFTQGGLDIQYAGRTVLHTAKDHADRLWVAAPAPTNNTPSTVISTANAAIHHQFDAEFQIRAVRARSMSMVELVCAQEGVTIARGLAVEHGFQVDIPIQHRHWQVLVACA
jgi:hypothetical protein